MRGGDSMEHDLWKSNQKKNQFLYDNRVFVIQTKPNYPSAPPFNPPEIFPEYPYEKTETDRDNHIYRAFRNILYDMDLDKDLFGRKDWNPFKNFVSKGDKIVIKSNFVHDKHPSHTQEGFESLITHPSLIRTIIDFAYIATGNGGEILVVDTPLDICNFGNLLSKSGLKDTLEFLKGEGVPVNIIDLREPKDVLKKYSITSAQGDPIGYEMIDLESQSSFKGLDSKNPNYQTVADKSVNHLDPYSGAEGSPNKFHSTGHHIYRVPKTVLNADLVISFAKMKTHKKAGITLSLKNMVGIISGKEYIPHFMRGLSPKGDEMPPTVTSTQIRKRNLVSTVYDYPIIGKRLVVNAGKVLDFLGIKKYVYQNIHDFGSWYGNDTIWRTIVDINKILFYADKNGIRKNTPQRKYLAFVDGIIGGDKEGPLNPTPKKCGLLIGGFNPVAVDSTCARIMGFDPKKIKTISGASKEMDFPLGCSQEEEIEVLFNNSKEITTLFEFTPPSGYQGHIEAEKGERSD